MVPADPTVADALSCLSIGGLGLKVFRYLQNETLRPLLRNALSYEADPGRDVFCYRFLVKAHSPAASAFNIASGCLVIGKITMTALTSGLALVKFWGPPPWYADGSTALRPIVDFMNAARSLEVFSERVDGAYGDLITEAAKAGMRGWDDEVSGWE